MNPSFLQSVLALVLLLSPAPIAAAQAQAEDLAPAKASAVLAQAKDTKRPALDDYDLGKKGLALGGYDPVAYFPAHGGKATKGLKTISAVHRGVLYRFASEKNKKAFEAAPASFEPAYGGWCAWAMGDGKGDKTEANPKSFTIEDGQLYVFYDGFWGDTRKSWKKKGSAPKLKGNADKNWKRMSGEDPKAAPKPAPTPKPAPDKASEARDPKSFNE